MLMPFMVMDLNLNKHYNSRSNYCQHIQKNWCVSTFGEIHVFSTAGGGNSTYCWF